MPSNASPPRILRFGIFALDITTGEMRKAGVLIHLPPQPFKILAMLASRAGQLVTRDEIHQQIWGSETFVDFEHGLNFAIKRIREALSDNAETPRYIETLPRRGYRFIAHLETAANAVSEEKAASQVVSREKPIPQSAPSQGLETAVARQTPPRLAVVARDGRTTSNFTGRMLQAVVHAVMEEHRGQMRWRRLAFVGMALAGLTVVLALVLTTDVGKKFRERIWSSSGSRQNQPLPRIESIAVLPLANLSHDPEQEYFADGMTDALITDLGKFGALRVISRTSIMRYKATKMPLPEIGRELNVDAIVEGAVQRSGNRVRITANLLHAATDRHLWADAYESDMQDVLMLQSEVARSIANEIEVTVTPSEQQRVASAPPVNPQAYQAYLKGRYYLNQATEEGMRKAVEYLERAVGIDANYAVAYAGLAEAYGFLGGAGMEVLTPAEGYGKSKTAALKALEIDEGVAEAHTMLANVKSQYDWDFPGAEKEYRRAIELNPNDARARVYYGQLLDLVGRHQEAITMTARAVELDPLTPLIHANFVYRYLRVRQFDKAIEEGHKAIADEPNFWITHLCLGQAYAQKGVFREAVVELEKAVELSGGNAYAKGALGHVYAVANRKGDAQNIIEEFDKQSKTKHVPAYCRAEIYAGLGEKDQAFVWLQQAYAERSGELVMIKIDPTFDGLRSDPRFQNLLRRMNFPP